MSAPVITNATPLTNFAVVDRPDLLLALWPGIISTTPDVMEEYQAGVKSGRLKAEVWRNLPVVDLSFEEWLFMKDLSMRLGRGERSCIAAAFHRHGLLVTDDLDARRVAQSKGIPITGSIGVLTACVRAGLVDAKTGNYLLGEMIVAGFRSPVQTLEKFLRK